MLVLSTLAAGAPAPAGPKDSAQAKAKLAAVRARINDLTSRLGKQLKERDSLSARLREAELAITSKRRHLDDLRTEQGEVERHRAALLAEQARDATVIGQERESLAAQVRAAYMIGRQEELKLLLNQNSPAALGRTFAYYGYFARQRVTRIASIGEDVARLEQLVSDIDAQTDKLKALQQDTTREMAALQNARADRADSVAALSKQLESGNEELGKLKREEQAVESLVADLQRMLQDFPSDPSKSFADMRGKLPWPVPGKLAAQYQASREGSAVRWNGIMIKTPRGHQGARALLRSRGLCRLAAGPRPAAHRRPRRRLHDALWPRRGALQGRWRFSRAGRRGGGDAGRRRAAAVFRDPRGPQDGRSEGLAAQQALTEVQNRYRRRWRRCGVARMLCSP